MIRFLPFNVCRHAVRRRSEAWQQRRIYALAALSAALSVLCLDGFGADVPGFTNAISHVRLLQKTDIQKTDQQNTETLEVKACGPPRSAWRTVNDEFRDFYTAAGKSETQTPAGVCFEYRFELGAAAQSQRSRDVQRVGRNLIAAADAWLLVPRRGVPHEVVFEVPSGTGVSAPWEPLDGALTRYRAGQAPHGSPLIVFGPFVRRVERLGDSTLEIVMLEGVPPLDANGVIEWVVQAASHVSFVYGVFPVPRVQVLVVPVLGAWPARGASRTLEAVPFARVMRSGGFTTQFFVNQTAPLSEYLADWTATHEFSHLLLPYVRRSDAWVSEGFASYYQNVLMARGGVLDERRAWQKLLEGFDRGRRGIYRDTLVESIRRRGPNMLMRMYWSGAAVALLADVELRRAKPPRSLDTLLEGLHRCCLEPGPVWTGRGLFERLDALAQRALFAPLYERTAHSTRFPNVDPVLVELGVRREGEQVVLDDTAPLAGVRRAIMARSVNTLPLRDPPPT